ncbi:TPA: hypothetical protein HA244_04515 [Candidatus Micrarchaeota archaeon]|nr:hypothetical protein [Candidatus Micrarchaeota archaeon]
MVSPQQRRISASVEELVHNVVSTQLRIDSMPVWLSSLPGSRPVKPSKLRALIVDSPNFLLDLLKQLSIHDLQGMQVKDLPSQSIDSALDSLNAQQHKRLAALLGNSIAKNEALVREAEKTDFPKEELRKMIENAKHFRKIHLSWASRAKDLAILSGRGAHRLNLFANALKYRYYPN